MFAFILVLLSGCAQENSESSSVVSEQEEKKDIIDELGLTTDSKEASEYTVSVNSALYSSLDFENTQEAEFAVKGLIDAPETLEIKDKSGNVIWSQKAYSFLDDYEKSPDTVNPSLWENTKNNHAYGLFEVTEGIYQVRGYDMANFTVIAGDSGWIVFDPLMSMECAEAAMQLVEKNLGERPIKAIIISHSHVDHFGGIRGIINEEDAADENLPIDEQLKSEKIPIIVPEGFTEHAVAENIYAGKAMSRRANYQYGVLLEAGVYGKMAMGIGMGQSTGTVSFLAPTYEITKTGEVINIDGVDFEFQLTPGTEAPAEMNTWIDEFKALWVAENCTGTLHNLYTLRGAQVRDGAAWAKYITEAITMYGKDAEVTFQSHNWPHWGNEVVNEYLVNTAAVYKFINDQTLTYINQGYTSDEISNMITLPEALTKNWYTRQYYGTVAHNSKAVYQKYMGWYDANPVNLNPLAPSDSAKKWVEYLGDTDEVLRLAKNDFDKGEYQWVAEITNVLVYADPTNTAARLLCADALEQLGYQSESGTWRNAYLCAALELRNGNMANEVEQTSNTGDVPKQMTAGMMFDYMGILLDKEAMSEDDITIGFKLSNPDEQHTIRIKNGVLLHYENALTEQTDITVTCPKNALFFVLQNNYDSLSQSAKIEGDTEKLQLFMSMLNQYSMADIASFNIVEP
ncbi:MAG: MBL fold metallo-hydrolase [Clostridia bacterium]|nr:MBL fold metallo-hydrolase [Clostridia bacterium]